MQYNQNNALLGERVPALAVSPLNGDVAIATSGGLTIYSAETEEWKDFTRANGLPEDQIVSLSFNEQGGLMGCFFDKRHRVCIPCFPIFGLENGTDKVLLG